MAKERNQGNIQWKGKECLLSTPPKATQDTMGCVQGGGKKLCNCMDAQSEPVNRETIDGCP